MTPQPAAKETAKKRSGWPRRLLRGFGTIVAAVWVVLEEWIWNSLTAAMAWLGRVPPVRWLEARIARLPSFAAMGVFLVPMALLLPAKILGLWLIGTGRVKLGITVFVGAKIIGTAVAARLFTLTKPALLRIAWFRRFYTWFTRWRDRLHDYLRSLRVWQQAKAWIAKVKAAARAWFRAVFSR
ncbi:MAG: hypothetical protein ABIP94_10925 [Planctomycetota bacterium]